MSSTSPSVVSRFRPTFRVLRRSQWALDAVLAAVLLLLTIPFVLYGFPYNSVVSNLQGLITLVAMVAAMVLRRASPPLALAIAWAGSIVLMCFAGTPGVDSLAALFVLYTSAAYGSRATLRAGFASAIVGSLIATAYILFGLRFSGDTAFSAIAANPQRAVFFSVLAAVLLVALFALMGLSWGAGMLRRQSLRTQQAERERAVAEALASAERHRNQIARDMHDVVAHSLAVIVAQSNGARYAATADPDVAVEALGTISTTAREALADVRSLLTQLRHVQAEGPQPTMADLDALYDQLRGAGMQLQVVEEAPGVVDPPPAVQLALYRILQEALTNAMRHAGGAPVHVRLTWTEDRVRFDVRNAYDGEIRTSGGYGLIGMRERAHLVGGAIDIGPRGREFVVSGRIPLEKESAE